MKTSVEKLSRRKLMLMLIVDENLHTKLEHFNMPTEKNHIFSIEYQSETQYNKIY